MQTPSKCRSHQRRVNPRLSVFRSLDLENTFYCDEEIPVARMGTIDTRKANAMSLDKYGEHEFLESLDIPIVVMEDESEDDYILLTAVQPKVKIALLQTQNVLRSSGFRDRKRPMLSKYPGLKYYSKRSPSSIPESPIEVDSVDTNMFAVSFNSPSSNDADESSYDNDQSFDTSERASIDGLDAEVYPLPGQSCSCRRNRFISSIYSIAISSSNSKFEGSLRRKSLCGALGMPANMPRRLSKMLSSFGDDSTPKKTRLTVPQIGCDEFNRITRKYSREVVKHVLFIPHGEIRIVRLSEERFFSVQEITNALTESLI